MFVQQCTIFLPRLETMCLVSLAGSYLLRQSNHFIKERMGSFVMACPLPDELWSFPRWCDELLPDNFSYVLFVCLFNAVEGFRCYLLLAGSKTWLR